MQIETACQPHHVAGEGAYSASTSSEPVLQYFPVQDRCEAIRLVLSANNQTWYEPPAEPVFEVSQLEIDGYPFRQLPRFIDEQHLKHVHRDIDISQSNAILRHLGRKFGMYGKSDEEAARIDMCIEGVEDLLRKLEEVWAVKKLEQSCKKRYEAAVLAGEQELRQLSTPGPGMASFEVLLGSASRGRADDGEQPWVVPSGPSIADMALFVLVDMHLQAFEGAMQRFPRLLAHHTRVAALPGVAEYLQSSNRHSLVWASDWIELYQERKARGGGPPELELPHPPAAERTTMFPFDGPREAEKDDNFADLMA